jgi:hypothetical protein
MPAPEFDEPASEREPRPASVLLVPPCWPPAPPGTAEAPEAPGTPPRRRGLIAHRLPFLAR